MQELNDFNSIFRAVQLFLLDSISIGARWYDKSEVETLKTAVSELSRHDLRRLLLRLTGETTPAMREVFWSTFFDAVVREHSML